MKTSKTGLLVSTLVFVFTMSPAIWAETIKLKTVVTVEKKLTKYHSECRATTAYADGVPAQVDVLTAYLSHEKKYPARTDAQKNSAEAVATFRKSGLGVRKIVAYCHACAEKAGYGRWCTTGNRNNLQGK